MLLQSWKKKLEQKSNYDGLASFTNVFRDREIQVVLLNLFVGDLGGMGLGCLYGGGVGRCRLAVVWCEAEEGG